MSCCSRLGVLTIAALVLLTACTPAAQPSPTAAPAEPAAERPAPTQAAPAKPAAKAEKPAAPARKQVVEFWTTDNEQYRVDVQDEVAARFMQQHPGIEVRVVPIDEATTSQRIATARGANRLPAMARVGIERIAPLLADGLLNVDASTKVIKDLGEQTFFEGTRRLVAAGDGKYAAVPFDGWLQAIWYRKDVFQKLGLAPPVTWEHIQKACETLAGQEGFLYGMTLGTDPGQNYTHQVFEQFAMSNGAFPFNPAGNVTMNTPRMVEALRFYTGLQKCATPGPNYWRQARQNYITGQSGMLFYSTYVMDDLAGLQEGVEPTIKDLSKLTGFAPEMVGPSGDKATYGTLVALAIFTGPNSDAAAEFAKFMLTDGYQEILALAPNGKVPVRSTAIAEWHKNEIFTTYPPDVLETISTAYDTMQRWAFAPQMGPLQRAVIGDMEGRLLIPQAISNVIQGTMTPEQAAAWLQERGEELKANREKLSQ